METPLPAAVPQVTVPELADVAVFAGPTEDTAFFAINVGASPTANLPKLALADRSVAPELAGFKWRTNRNGLVYRCHHDQRVAARVYESAGARVLRIHTSPDIAFTVLSGDPLDLRICNLKPGRAPAGTPSNLVSPGETLRAFSQSYAAALAKRVENQDTILGLFPAGRVNTILSPTRVRSLLNNIAENPDLMQRMSKLQAARDTAIGLFGDDIPLPTDQQFRRILDGESQRQAGFEAQYAAIRKIWPDARTKRAERQKIAQYYS